MNTNLKSFNLITQYYGDWLKGFDWTIYGCLTFKNPISFQHGDALVKNFMRRLGIKIKSHIPYTGVAEHKYSGLGAAIKLHYHFLASCPPKWADQFHTLANDTWSQIGGDCLIHPYDSSKAGAYYIAKTASQDDFHLIEGNLDYLKYTGQHDLYAAAQESPYVPEQAKGLLAPITTLVLQSPPAQPVGTAPGVQLQLSAIKKKAPLVKSSATKKAIVVPPTKMHPSSSPSHAKKIALPGPKIPLVAYVWRKHLAESLHQSEVPLTDMQYGQLTSLRNKVGEAVLPLIEYVIYNWETFAKKASSKAGHLVSPSVPNISFLLKHHSVALQLAYASAKQKKWKNSNDLKLIQAFPAL